MQSFYDLLKQRRAVRSYTGEPDRIADELACDAAVQAADTILLTVPSQLGVDYNAAMLETIARDIAPAIGWSPKNDVAHRGEFV